MFLFSPSGTPSLAGRLKRLVRAHQFHRAHRAQARGILQSLERTRGILDRAVRARCNEYAVDVFGDATYAPWLHVYSAMSGGFREGWIPDNYYGLVVVPRLKGDYGKVASLKPLQSALLRSEAFPDVMSFVNGVFFDSDYALVPEREVPARLFARSDRVVFKLDNSMQGKGIHFFTREGFEVGAMRWLGNGLFQSCIAQHESLAAFAAGSVATLRITTFCSGDGEVSVRGVYLRLGVTGETHVQSRTSIRVPIDRESGEFSGIGYTAGWGETTEHPGSGRKFAGQVFPKFREACELVRQLHARVPYVRCIGWDVTVDRDERVRIMEWNGEHNDIKFSEATQGPCFAGMGWESLWKTT